MTKLTLGPEIAGRRLDMAVAAAMGWSRNQAERAIEAGLVQVNGALEQRRYLVQEGDKLAVANEPKATIIPPEVTILYQDKDLMVVDKPAGILTHPGTHHTEGTLADFARPLVQDDDPLRPGIVHRLDRDTSGVLVITKTSAAKLYMQKLFHDRKVTKTYLALVMGRITPSEAVIELPLARSPRRQTRQAVTADGRQAATRYRVTHEYPGYSLLEVQPLTGRTHQIRAHMEAIGHRVAGDQLYGAPAEPTGLDRQFLHATRIEFTGPSGQLVDVHSPLPPDLAAVLASLG